MKENYLLTAEVRDRALALRRTGLSDLIRVSDAAPGIFPAAGGVSAAFSDGADGRPLRVLKAKVTADQAGTGDPSAGNIRPISGRTGAVIRRCSLYDPAEVTMGVTLNLATGEVEEAEGVELEIPIGTMIELPRAAVTADEKAKLEQLKQAMLAGRFIFAGEIYDRQGKLRCRPDESIRDDRLLQHMDWLVKGVDILE